VPAGEIAANVNYDSGNIWGATRDITFIGLGKSSLDTVATEVAAFQQRVLKADQFPERGSYYRSDQFNFAKIGVPAFYFSGGTDFLIWREANSVGVAYPCSQQGPASWYPLESTQIVIFDEQEQPVTAEDCPSGDPFCEQNVVIPNEANRVNVERDLEVPFDFGWIYLNLQHLNPGFVTIYDDSFVQSWTTVVMTAGGRFSVGFDAIQLDNASTAVSGGVILPVNIPD